MEGFALQSSSSPCALSAAVRPSLSLRAGSAPAARSAWTMRVWFLEHAYMSAVAPRASRRFTSAEAARSRSTTRTSPLNTAK